MSLRSFACARGIRFPLATNSGSQIKHRSQPSIDSRQRFTPRSLWRCQLTISFYLKRNPLDLSERWRTVTIGTIRPDRMATTGRLSEPALPVSPQATRPAVPERGICPGGVSGCAAMPGSEKVQPARQSWRIQGGQDTVQRFPVASRAIEVSVMGEGEGSGGGDRGARGALSPVGGSKGPEPLASPNVLHWVGWLPFTSRCGAGPAVPASLGHRALLRPAALGSGRPGSRPSRP